MIYNGKEYEDSEILKMIVESSDKTESKIKADEGTWKERFSKIITESVSLGLRHTLTYNYFIQEEEGKQSICKCTGISEISEVL